jgi:hypothetical protein
MKQLLLILTFLSLTTFASGQTWAPTGAKWTFGFDWIMNQGTGYNEWVSTGDTLVGGHVCKLIKRTGDYCAGDISRNLITYEDSGRVYLYNVNQFTILYDFNKNAGDSWTFMTDTCGLVIHVDSTSIDTINGFPLKSLFVYSAGWEFGGKILEHIGHVGRPTPDVTFRCYGIIEDINYYTGLRCYEDSAFGFYSFGIAPSCHYTEPSHIGIDEVQNPFGLSLFPNPTSSELNIKANLNREFHYSIYNSLGQLVKSGMLQSALTSIDVRYLTTGFYNIEFSADSKTERHRFIVER